MQQPLVSVLTPCYNSGGFIHRLLDSVLMQTYPNIEMFVVDDGSIDDTKDIVNGYIERFKEKGFSLEYVYQENAGVSVAIQNGIQLLKGKYFVWPDSDDYYSSCFAIEKMVNILESASEEFALVRSQELLIDEESFSKIEVLGKEVKKNEDKTLFEDCLFGKNGFYYVPGAYMVNFKKLINSAEWPMFTAKQSGQNWQILLPVLWNFRCISIPEAMYSVLIRKNSHCRINSNDYEYNFERQKAYMESIIGTLERIKGMPLDVRDSYKKQIKSMYCRRLLSLSFQNGRKNDFLHYYKKVKEDRLRLFFMKIVMLLGISSWVYGITHKK